MKELLTDSGGRRYYNEDFENLQELALSPTQFFKALGKNVIISGCELTYTDGTSSRTVNISEGYVYIDGKVRYLGASSVDAVLNYTGPFYIITSDTDGPAIAYASGTSKTQYKNYGASFTLSKPATGSYIEIKSLTDTTCRINTGALITENLKWVNGNLYVNAYNLKGTIFTDKDGNGVSSSTIVTVANSFSSQYVNKLSGLPSTSKVIIASLTANDSLSFGSFPIDGTEIYIIIKNAGTSEITITLPSYDPYVALENTKYTIKAGSYLKLSAIRCDSQIYIGVVNGASVTSSSSSTDSDSSSSESTDSGSSSTTTTSYNVSATSADSHGSVSGGGVYAEGSTAILTATASSGYNFHHWTVNGVQVTTNPYIVNVNSAIVAVATFVQTAGSTEEDEDTDEVEMTAAGDFTVATTGLPSGTSVTVRIYEKSNTSKFISMNLTAPGPSSMKTVNGVSSPVTLEVGKTYIFAMYSNGASSTNPLEYYTLNGVNIGSSNYEFTAQKNTTYAFTCVCADEQSDDTVIYTIGTSNLTTGQFTYQVIDKSTNSKTNFSFYANDDGSEQTQTVRLIVGKTYYFSVGTNATDQEFDGNIIDGVTKGVGDVQYTVESGVSHKIIFHLADLTTE